MPEIPPAQLLATPERDQNAEMVDVDEKIQPLDLSVVEPLNSSAIALRGKEVNWKYVPGQRRGSRMIYSNDEDQIYKRNKKNADGTEGWTCTTRNCSERITLHQNGKCFYSDTNKGHKHEKKANIQQVVDVKNEIKVEISKVETVASGSSAGAVRKVFYSKVTSTSDIGISYKSMERGLLKIRNGTLPKSPKNCEEIINAYKVAYVIENYGMTIRESDKPRTMYYKYTFESNEHSFCIFASDEIVAAIKEHVPQDSRRYFMDATFKIVPMGIFKQLLILYAEFMGQIVPFCFVLMDRKTESAYTDIFKYINDNIIDLNGKSFMTDYEKAMRNSLKKLFPRSNLDTCWFVFLEIQISEI